MANAYFSSGEIIGDGTATAIGTAEKDVVIVSELRKLKKTQLSVYLEPTLGTHTSMEFRYYYQHETSGSWHELVKQNASDNTLDDFPAIVDANTPNSGNTVYQFPLGSCAGFKVTAKGVGGAGGSARVKVMARDN